MGSFRKMADGIAVGASIENKLSKTGREVEYLCVDLGTSTFLAGASVRLRGNIVHVRLNHKFPSM